MTLRPHSGYNLVNLLDIQLITLLRLAVVVVVVIAPQRLVAAAALAVCWRLQQPYLLVQFIQLLLAQVVLVLLPQLGATERLAQIRLLVQ
jgi:uncharacterized membrane protein